MYLTITNLFNEESTDVVGDPQQAEEQIRALFPGLIDDIPAGNLDDLLRAVNRMYGISLVIVDASDHQKTPPLPHIRPVNDDPWVRESDSIPDFPIKR